MSVPVCNHLKEDGVFCSSPAIKGRQYCYFHTNQRARRLKAARARRRGDNPALNLPFPEDMHAVQVSLAEILWALAEHRIDHKAAGLMLYTLQQASTNLNQTPRWHGQREAVEDQRPHRAVNLPDFEKRFGLPNNLDLDTDPDLQEQLSSSSDNRPLTTGNSTVSRPQLSSSSDSSDNCSPTTDNPPVPTDRVPVPENVLEELKMTEAEKLQFFNYCMQFDTLGNEQQLKVNWLRQKRLDEQEDSEKGAELRAECAAWEALLARPRDDDDSETEAA